jgi:hypothetical protein
VYAVNVQQPCKTHTVSEHSSSGELHKSQTKDGLARNMAEKQTRLDAPALLSFLLELPVPSKPTTVGK